MPKNKINKAKNKKKVHNKNKVYAKEKEETEYIKAKKKKYLTKKK